MTAIFTTAETELNAQLTGLQEQLIALADLLRGQHERLTQQAATITDLVALNATLTARVTVLEAGGVTLPPPVPDPEPEPAPEPTPVGAYVLVDAAALKARPTEGAAWDNLKAWADKPAGTPNLSDQGDMSFLVLLAKSLVYARTGNRTMRTDAIAMFHAMRGTETSPSDTLGMARKMIPSVLALNFIGGFDDPLWLAWFKSLRDWTIPDHSGRYTLATMQDIRPNNHGTWAGASRIAYDLHFGDAEDLKRAITVFKGFLGDWDAYHGFTYGALDWQADPKKPVGINPPGGPYAGIQPEEARRGGNPPTLSGDGIMYSFEALAGILSAALLLQRNGYPDVIEWSDRAILRAYVALIERGHEPAGDDRWEAHAVNYLYGTSYPTVPDVQPGKGMGFAEWLFS